jgi:hypothetical protein
MRTYFRIVRDAEPKLEDFWSLRAQGKPLSDPRYASPTRLEKISMDDYVELYDLRSGNLMANFDDEREAWEELRHMAVKFGLEQIEGLGLSQVRDGQDTLIAMEDDLVQRVARELSLEPVASESRR